MTENEVQELIMQSLAVANNYIRTGQVNKAIALLEQVRKIEPDNNLAESLMQNLFGTQVGRAMVDVTAEFGAEWRGEDLNGKSIEIFCDQGVGDTIQLLRYVRELKKTGVTIFLNSYAHHKSLDRLFSSLDFVDSFSSIHTRCDFHANIMGLPAIMKGLKKDVYYPAYWTEIMELGDIPAPVDFGDFSSPWLDEGFKVGIAWYSNPDNYLYLIKSMTLAQTARLESSTHQLISLLPSEEKTNIMTQLPIKDFKDTAGIISAMDVVVSVDTAVLHLAGSMGKKTLGLLPVDSDPRWGLDETTPWYPSMELFRQTDLTTWNDVLFRVKERLEQLKHLG